MKIKALAILLISLISINLFAESNEFKLNIGYETVVPGLDGIELAEYIKLIEEDKGLDSDETITYQYIEDIVLQNRRDYFSYDGISNFLRFDYRQIRYYRWCPKIYCSPSFIEGITTKFNNMLKDMIANNSEYKRVVALSDNENRLLKIVFVKESID